MSSKVRQVFPTYICQGSLPSAQARRINKQLKREIEILQKIDRHGMAWSKKYFPNMYTSYATLTKLHETSPYFAELKKLIDPHVRKFIRKQQWALMGRKIEMTTCWANSSRKGSHHTMHLHPYAVISGVYYVEAPPGSSVLKLEDPRMQSYMAAPPRGNNAPPVMQPFIEIAPKAGHFVLFEGWMRHEVPPHLGNKPRLGIAFNYEWT